MRKRSDERHVSLEPISTEIENENNEYKENTPFSSVHSVSSLTGILFIVILMGIFGLVFLADNSLPSPIKNSDMEKYSDSFNAEQAKNYLMGFTDLGPRIVGSYENENISVDYLKREIDDISYNRHNSKNIEVDLQVVSGSYYLDYKPFGTVNAYGNVQNLVVKLSSINSNNNSILVNAHFDSVPTSPGGSDDGINCAAMLEILKILSKSEEKFKHDIIFLFNGAEESFLQASHGFITQHRWAERPKVVVNLEAAGSGGKIMLFQTGPGHSWLVHKFRKVPYPSGQVAGEELFQSNLIPSDTDFRVFRDFGKLIGYDMAFVKNGYVYHTKYDGIDNIPLGSFQHVGANVLSLVKTLANSDEIDNLESQDQTKVVYYDVFRLFMVVYTITVASILNYCTALLSIIVAIKCFFVLGIGFNVESLIHISLNISGIILGWVFSVGYVVIIGIMLDFVGYSMSWYRNPWIILGLYVLPVTGICCSVTTLFNKYCQKRNHSVAALTQLQINLVRLIYCVPLLVGTILNIRAIHVIQILVFFNAIAFAVIHFSKLQYSVRWWQVLHILSTLISATYLMSTTLTLLSFVIPITGRFGNNQNPELYVGFATLLLTILIISLFVPLITLVRKPSIILITFFAIFLLFLIIVFTPLGFPYSGESDSPAPQRYWIMHTSREFYDEYKNIRKQDSGFYIQNLDRNSPKSVEKYVEDLAKAQSIEEICGNELYCGMPIIHPRTLAIINKSTWIPAEQPVFQDITDLTLISKEKFNSSLVKYSFSTTGPSHMSIYFSLKNGVILKQFSLTDEIKEGPKWGERSTFFINYAWGLRKTPLNFSVIVEVPENWNETVIDVIVLGRYVHDKQNIKTPHFTQFIAEFPEWTDVTAWLGSLKAWTF